MRETSSAMLHSRSTARLFIIFCWLAGVLFFAIQWFVYDSARGNADPFRFYLWWSFYTWGVLTPIVVYFAYRNPIDARTWKRAFPLHLAASFVIGMVAISAEAMLGKLGRHQDLSVEAALRHYFSRHAQASLLTYWMLVGVVHLYRMRDEGRRRELRASKLEAQLSAAQLQALRAQIHPHFLFNTLQAAMTLLHEDPDGAEDILLRLSDLLRVSLDGSNVQEVPLERELEVLELYMGIQSRRFGDRLQFDVSVAKGVRECMVPVLILQPLVENAIGHGIGKHKGSDTVTIRGFQEGEFLRLEVLNLNSHLEEKSLASQRHGVGLSNTRARLEQLYGGRQRLGLRNLEPTGVCAEILIPLRSRPVLVEEAVR
jgi:two-component system, LytTR family, sensor kinase